MLSLAAAIAVALMPAHAPALTGPFTYGQAKLIPTNERWAKLRCEGFQNQRAWHLGAIPVDLDLRHHVEFTAYVDGGVYLAGIHPENPYPDTMYLGRSPVGRAGAFFLMISQVGPDPSRSLRGLKVGNRILLDRMDWTEGTGYLEAPCPIEPPLEIRLQL